MTLHKISPPQLLLFLFLIFTLSCKAGTGHLSGGAESASNLPHAGNSQHAGNLPDANALPGASNLPHAVHQTTDASSIEARVEAILNEMTLEEKVGQMTQIALNVLGKGESVLKSYEPFEFDPEMMKTAFQDYHLGSVLTAPNNRGFDVHGWNETILHIQQYALEHSRLKIPIIYGVDMIHGASYVVGATLFPQHIGMAATWNPGLVRRGGEITAYESRAAGVPWTFSPVLDLGADPRWPRQWETFGEDPYLASVMAHAIVKGFEGEDNDIGSPFRIASTLKHFTGYSHTLSGRDRTPAWIPEPQLREYHIPPFRAGLDAGAMTVMLNSGEVNGMPVHADKSLITDLLKEELGFEGFVLTDWEDINFLHTRHRIADSKKEAIRLAINAGVDMSMVPYNFEFNRNLIELVHEGAVSMQRIDDAVRRILTVKMKLNLFETPYTLLEDYPEYASDAFKKASYETALESITLLKNENSILPLDKESRILLAGPAANTMRPLNGGWSYSWQGHMVEEVTDDKLTIYDAMAAEIGADLVTLYETVRFDPQGSFDEEFTDDFNEFRSLAARADYIVLAIGENSYCEGPGDLDDLYLSENQQKLVLEASATGKPVILLMTQGRPRIISKVEPSADAIFNAYLPGNYGGEALVSLLFGDANPSGKLPYTYPRYPNKLIPYYHKYTENLEQEDSPSGTKFYPQFEFGFGLSYSDFDYMSLSTDKRSYAPDETIELTVTLRNASGRDGKEVVQIYSSQQYASLTPSVKRLRAFEKVMIPANSRTTVRFSIPVTDLAFVNADSKRVVEEGEFVMRAAGMSTSIRITGTHLLD